MSITLLTRPDPYALTQGGRMTAQFSLNRRTLSAGTKATNVLGGSVLVAGQRIVLRWNAQTLELVVSDAPLEPNEIPAGTLTPEHIDQLIAILKDYYPLREDFTNFRNASVSSGGFLDLKSIAFDARRPGEVYNLTLGQSGPMLIGNLVKGAAPRYRERYSAYVEIYLQPPGGSLDPDTFERVGSYPVETDATGLATLDVGAVLHPLLQPDLPDAVNHAPTLARTSGRAYYLAYGEAWGNPLRPGKMTRDGIRYAYLGGADYVHRAGSGYDFLAPRLGAQADADAALRVGAGESARYIAPDSLQYLTFLNTRASRPGVRLWVEVTTATRKTTFADLFTLTPWAVGQKITLPVGPGQLRLVERIGANQKLVSYSCRLIDGQGAFLSRAYRYLLDYAYRPIDRQFLYVNSLGCVETLTTFGKGSTEWNRLGELAEQALPLGYGLEGGSSADYGVSLQQQVDVTTGFRQKGELRGWLDFYRSPDRYRLHPNNSGTWQLLPISVNSKSIREAKDGETLYAHQFGYVYKFREAWFTEDDTPGDLTPPPGFAPVGTVQISVPTVVQARDATVPDVVRSLTSGALVGFNQAVSWGNHAEVGYLDQQAGDARYPTQESVNQSLTSQTESLDSLKATLIKTRRIVARAVPA